MDVPDLRLKVPCADRDDFFARLAARVEERGLRVPAEDRPAVGAAVTVVLELRNGELVTAAGVVEGHLAADGRPAVSVRILRFAPGAAADEAGAPAWAGAGGADRDDDALPAGDEPLGDPALEVVPIAEVVEDEPAAALPAHFGSTTASGEIVAAVARRTARAERGVLAVILAALAVAAAGLAAARWLPARAEAAAAAHVEAADRLFAEGRLTGDGGALEHLVAARRLRPHDAAPRERLARVADLLEALAARALERGDAAVAAVHLGWAREAAPDRASIRASLEALGADDPPREAPRSPAGARGAR